MKQTFLEQKKKNLSLPVTQKIVEKFFLQIVFKLVDSQGTYYYHGAKT